MDQKAPRATCASLGPRPPPNSSHSRCMPPAVPRLPPVATSLPALARVLTAAPFLHLHLHPCGSHACLAAATPVLAHPVMPSRAASLFPARARLPPTVINALAAESSRPVLLEQNILFLHPLTRKPRAAARPVVPRAARSPPAFLLVSSILVRPQAPWQHMHECTCANFARAQLPVQQHTRTPNGHRSISPKVRSPAAHLVDPGRPCGRGFVACTPASTSTLSARAAA